MKIDIQRSKSHKFGIFRKMDVYVDGERVSALKVGQQVQLELDAANLIWVKMDWCRSMKLPLNEEVNSFVCGEENFFRALFATFLNPLKALSLRKLDDSEVPINK